MSKVIFDTGFKPQVLHDRLRVHQIEVERATGVKTGFFFEVYGDPVLTPDEATHLGAVLSTASFSHLPTDRGKRDRCHNPQPGDRQTVVVSSDPGDECGCASCMPGLSDRPGG